ncbi:hypothetical protein GCM10007940_44990 [Portibacter lacus]|uniref:Radical SAM core domain-containing protein n=2 Tax=Portibacter lacus TaxID=1099794 RepID=A0AA37ST17_9BACT|nr:hypothetical protein GCM10007940_44990 [Portibacter lacus]
MIQKFMDHAEGQNLHRGFYLKGKYTWDMFNPHWPSKAFNRFYTTQLREHGLLNQDQTNIRRLLIAITKKCPLQCEHCSEWDTLNEKDQFTLDDFFKKIDGFVDDGVSQLVFSGGEPLIRFNDLVEMIQRYRNKCNQWVYTSGYQLTPEKAERLAAAGLNGVAISLDHHIEEFHNLFRGNQKSFQWVKDAVKNCKDAGLMVTINSCLTKTYLNDNNTDHLINLVKEWNVPILNILEPRAVGHYANKDVELSIREQQMIESKVRQYNNKKHLEYPLISYPAMFRKNLPCGGGRSYLFLDYDGTLSPCPFCKTPIKNHLELTNKCEIEAVLN